MVRVLLITFTFMIIGRHFIAHFDRSEWRNELESTILRIRHFISLIGITPLIPVTTLATM